MVIFYAEILVKNIAIGWQGDTVFSGCLKVYLIQFIIIIDLLIQRFLLKIFTFSNFKSDIFLSIPPA